jgi:hypothetical protein
LKSRKDGTKWKKSGEGGRTARVEAEMERGVGKIQEETREGKEEDADGCGREVG